MNTSAFVDHDAGLTGWFGTDGPLAGCLQDFAPRPEQLAMARAVAEAIDRRHNLVVEAGTGTGKTLAYLVPLLLGDCRAVISTATRTLQDQLYHRDLPMLARGLGRPVTVRLLKGRRNYLCRYRLEQVLAAPGGQTRELRRLSRWAARTRSGDISELREVPETSALWPEVTSTADNCLGSACPRFDDCHVALARQAAREADVVVVNHHLLMADLSMKEEGFGELLPGAEVVVVDEAHHFPDVAQGFFTRSVGAGQIRDLLADLRAEARGAGLALDELGELASELDRDLAAAREALPPGTERLAWSMLPAELSTTLDDVQAGLEALAGTLPQDEVSAGLRRCRERCSAVARTLATILGAGEEDGLRWLRPTARGFVVNLTPLDAAEQIRSLLDGADCSWIFTSATLAVGESFDHFTARLGLERVATRQIPSPFDFGRSARLYLPDAMPDPASAHYTQAVLDAVKPVLEASGGRAFLLFTSHRALREAAARLARDDSFDYPLLVQGSAPRPRLLDDFVGLERAVLLGTATFWEGVDIRGPDLVLVMIDRLPFASPGDPLLAARLDAIREQGGNPFRDYQLPQAVLALKQGVGRLIRDYHDYGVVMICDPRLTSRSYGRVFLQSLPPMPLIREARGVREFYREREQA